MKGNAKPQKIKRDVVPSRYNYGFLFKKSQLPKADLRNLLYVESFVRAADDLMDKGHGIEDIDIYNIVRDLYMPKYHSGERSGAALKLRKAVIHFSKVLYDDENAWMQ